MPAKKKVAKKAAKKTARNADADSTESGLSELTAMMSRIRKGHGERTIQTASCMRSYNLIPTGVFILDLALCGGLPEGRANMLYGKESSAKSTIYLKAAGCFQKKYPDKHVVWVDSEKLFDPVWAEANGVDLERFHVMEPDTGEEAVDLFASMMEPLEVGWVILDSIPACVPKAMAERSAEDKTMGALAALMGLLCGKILDAWGREKRRGHEVTVSLVNQIRMKLGLVFGSPETLPGGRQINHLPIAKVKLRGKIVEGEDSRGHSTITHNEIDFDIEKAKGAGSIKKGTFYLVIDPDATGLPMATVDELDTVMLFAQSFGLLTGAGAHYTIAMFEDVRAQSVKKDAIKQYLRDNPFRCDILKASIIMLQRASKKISPLPPDNYLVSPGAVNCIPDWVIDMANDLLRSGNHAVDEDEEVEDEEERDEPVRRRRTFEESDEDA